MDSPKLTLRWLQRKCRNRPGAAAVRLSGAAARVGSGTLAVISHKGPHQFVLVFPPNGDEPIHQIPIHDEHGQHLKGKSLAFDRRGHLYIGMHDTSPDGKYFVLEVDIHNWKVVRTIVVPGSPLSMVATDDQSYLYVNTTAFGTGVIDIFRNNLETKPYLQIVVNLHNPRRLFVSRDALWVGYTGLLSPCSRDFACARSTEPCSSQSRSCRRDDGES